VHSRGPTPSCVSPAHAFQRVQRGRSLQQLRQLGLGRRFHGRRRRYLRCERRVARPQRELPVVVGNGRPSVSSRRLSGGAADGEVAREEVAAPFALCRRVGRELGPPSSRTRASYGYTTGRDRVRWWYSG